MPSYHLCKKSIPDEILHRHKYAWVNRQIVDNILLIPIQDQPLELYANGVIVYNLTSEDLLMIILQDKLYREVFRKDLEFATISQLFSRRDHK